MGCQNSIEQANQVTYIKDNQPSKEESKPTSLVMKQNGRKLANQHNYKDYTIQGFRIKITVDLTENLRSNITLDLQQMIRILNPQIINIYRSRSKIYINQNYYYNGVKARGATTHHSQVWLRDNGNLEQKKNCVEIYSIQDYIQWKVQQPSILLHQFSHVYHQYLREIRNPVVQKITKVFELNVTSKKYENVKYIRGKTEKHYALTNQMEYFAQCSEAFFTTKRFRNDYYPFMNEEFKAFDHQGYEMIKQAYQVNELKMRQWVDYPEDYDPKIKQFKK